MKLKNIDLQKFAYTYIRGFKKNFTFIYFLHTHTHNNYIISPSPFSIHLVHLLLNIKKNFFYSNC